MRKSLLISMVLFFGQLMAHAQTARFEATVVDAVTRVHLPFASVYVGPEASTITNLDGEFVIDCAPDAMLHISYVGYRAVHVKAAELKGVVTLKPNEHLLPDLVVTPVAPLINKICKETLTQMRNHKRKTSEFFYRQTAFADSTCYEFLEAFLSGGSGVALHDLQLMTGRYAGIVPDSSHFYSYFGNFYTFSEIVVAASYRSPSLDADLVPLFRNFKKYYKYSYRVIDDDGRRFDYTCDHLKPIVFNCGLAMDNGFVATDKHTWSHKDEYGLIDFEFSIYPDVMKEDGGYYLSVAIWGFRNARVKYVHEFQHALRICGLRDMADNFILK